jgi:hypothetical protein
MTHSIVDTAAAQVQTLAKELKTVKSRDRLTLVAAAIELLRRAQGMHPSASMALVNFLSRVPDVAWGDVKFSLTQALLTRGRELAVAQASAGTSDADIDELLIQAAALFADVVAETPAEATQDVLEALIVELASQPRPSAAATTQPPHLFRDYMLGAVFQPHPLTEAAAKELNVQPVLYRGVNGAQVRGVLFFGDGGLPHSVLLETGEYVQMPFPETTQYVPLSAEDALALPISLLAYLVVFADELQQTGALTPVAHRALLTLGVGRPANLQSPGILGKFTVEPRVVSPTKDVIKILQNTFDTHIEAAKIGALGATGPSGATFRIPVPGTTVQVLLAVSADTRGPYTTASLMQDDQTLLRLDRPRENSFAGVYAFPIVDQDDRISECIFLKVV